MGRSILSDARYHVEQATRGTVPSGSYVETLAQIALAEATIALAEQKRIANLIAVGANGARMVAEGLGSSDDYLAMYAEINPIIREGLGLGGESDAG